MEDIDLILPYVLFAGFYSRNQKFPRVYPDLIYGQRQFY